MSFPCSTASPRTLATTVFFSPGAMAPTTVSWPPCVEGASRTFTLSSTVTWNGVTGVALGAAGLPEGLGSGEGSGDRWKNAGVPVASGLLSSSRKSPLSLQATPARAKGLSTRSSTASARAISSPPSADASGGYRRREQESLGQHLARQDEGHGDVQQPRGRLHRSDAAGVECHVGGGGREGKAAADPHPEERVRPDGPVHGRGDAIARQGERGDQEQRLESQRQEEKERHLPQRLLRQARRNQVPVAQDHPHRHGTEHECADDEA